MYIFSWLILKLQNTCDFSPEYLSLRILNLAEFSSRCRGLGKLLHCVPRVSPQIVLVLEKAFRSHSHDLLICKRKESAHLLSIRPCAECLPDGPLFNPLHTVRRKHYAHFWGNWSLKRLNNLSSSHSGIIHPRPIWNHWITHYLPLPFIFSRRECMKAFHGQCGQIRSNLNVVHCKNGQANGDLYTQENFSIYEHRLLIINKQYGKVLVSSSRTPACTHHGPNHMKTTCLSRTRKK